MLSVINKPIMLSVFMSSVVMLTRLSKLSPTMLFTIMLRVTFKAVMLSVVKASVVTAYVAASASQVLEKVLTFRDMIKTVVNFATFCDCCNFFCCIRPQTLHKLIAQKRNVRNVECSNYLKHLTPKRQKYIF